MQSARSHDTTSTSEVYFIDAHEVKKTPRAITPAMMDCARCLRNDIFSSDDTPFTTSRWKQLVNVIPAACFFLILFGLALSFDSDRPEWNWLGRLMAASGFVVLVIMVVVLQSRGTAWRKAWQYVLKNGKQCVANVLHQAVDNRVAREIRLPFPPGSGSVSGFDIQWVYLTRITLKIEGYQLDIATYRPEIIRVFQPGAQVPVLWHPDCPDIFVPIGGNAE